jgi:peptidoglycan/xylan/chitin deacetylase (PgdA/CDA1 family)
MRTIRKLLHAFQALIPESPGGVQILIHHLVDGGTAFPVDISSDVFRSHLMYLKEHSEVCSLEESLVRLSEGRQSRLPTVVITFDDAYENFYQRVWPIIQEFQIPVTLYVPVDFIEGKTPAPLRNSKDLLPCSWKQIGEMAESGLVSIGSHSTTHPDLRRLDPEMVHSEIHDSRKKLEDKLSRTVQSFAYPRALWSGKLEKVVRENYDSAVIGGGVKMTSRSWNRYRLTRIPIRNDMPADLGRILSSNVWLEERLASWVRAGIY